MAGPLLEQELLRPGYHPTKVQRPDHSQPSSKALRSASNPSAEEKESLTRSSSSPGQQHRLPSRMVAPGVFQRAPWSNLVSGASRVLDPYIPTPVVGIERFASRKEEQQANDLRQANRMSRQAQKNVQYAVNSFLGKAANGTLSASEQPIAAALGLGSLQQAQKYLQVKSWNCDFCQISVFTVFFSATLPHKFRDKGRCCGEKLILHLNNISSLI